MQTEMNPRPQNESLLYFWTSDSACGKVERERGASALSKSSINIHQGRGKKWLFHNKYVPVPYYGHKGFLSFFREHPS